MQLNADGDSQNLGGNKAASRKVIVELRGAWQDQGYFKIAVDPHAQSVGGDAEHERFLVSVHPLNEGPQFHLEDIRFADGAGIPDAELRQTFLLREGEIFDVARVGEGIEALKFDPRSCA